jgi:hypothetical protein
MDTELIYEVRSLNQKTGRIVREGIFRTKGMAESFMLFLVPEYGDGWEIWTESVLIQPAFFDSMFQADLETVEISKFTALNYLWRTEQ